MKKTILLILLFAFSCYAETNDDTIYQLEQRINELTDQIEKINHKYNLLLKKYDSLAADIEFRFKELDGKKTVSKPKDQNSIKAEFDKAFKNLKDQQYEAAEESFAEFIKSYPNNELTGGAYYWLGETYSLRKRYDKAATSFIHSFSKFPRGNKADLSILKAASSLNKLNKKKEACLIISKLKAKSASLNPTTGNLYKKEMKEIGCK
ncbi:MAG: tol-pal system protein YbgF [Pseudomonadota bacterium]